MNTSHFKRGLSLALIVAAAPLNLSAAGLPPKVFFDLSHFKLTLPVNSSNGTTGEAATIYPDQLEGRPGYSSDWFHTNLLGSLEFYAPSNGATTTPGQGSDHTRSELRELYNPDGVTEWTNRTGGTLNATCRITQTSASTDSTVVGQIHGLDNPLLLLIYSTSRQQVEARVYHSSSGSGSTVYPIKAGVPIGQRIAYTVQWIGSTLSVTVNGTALNVTTSSSWNNKPVYFKLGAYSAAPASGNPVDDGTRVLFDRFSIQH